jgi:hypothetical protein
MRVSTLFVLAAPLAVLAAPLRAPGKRAAADILVFTFADVLEQFESEMYKAAAAKFTDADFTAAGFTSGALVTQQVANIISDETTHSVVLQKALRSWGAEPLTTCQFGFEPALTDVATMIATARIVEEVGISAYLGAATLLTDPVILTAAGSILTVEARHQTLLNILAGTGKSVHSPFDIALTPSEVLAIAGPFISGCDLGVPANPTLSVTNTGPAAPGTKLEFSSAAINATTDGFHCQMIVGGATFARVLPINECVVPEDVTGAVAIFITSDANPLANNVRDRATNKLVAGPTFVFVDTTTELLGSSARQVAGAPSGGESTSTSTISPSEASDIIAGATSTGSAPVAGQTGAVEPVGNAGAAPPVSSTPDLSTGPSADGRLVVDGWSADLAAAGVAA